MSFTTILMNLFIICTFKNFVPSDSRPKLSITYVYLLYDISAQSYTITKCIFGGEHMSIDHFRNLCERHHGLGVEIRTHDGRVHRGIIERVDNRRVFLRPINRGQQLGGFGYGPWGFGGGYGFEGYGGFGYGPWGFGGGYGFEGYGGFGYGVALGAIATLVLLPFF